MGPVPTQANEGGSSQNVRNVEVLWIVREDEQRRETSAKGNR